MRGQIMTRVRKIFSVIIIGLITTKMLVADPVWAATSSDLKKQKEEIENQQSQTQDAYDNANDAASEIAAEQSELGEQINATNDELVGLLADISLIEDEISSKEAEIEVTQSQYDEAKAQEEALYKAMCARIKYMYEKGETTYVEILMSATSFSDFTTKAEYVEQLYDYDRQQLEAYVEVQQETATYKVILEEEKSELETTKEELSEEQELLQAALDEYKAAYADYETELANARAQAAAYKEKLKAQTAQIASLDTEIAAKEAEEEAARKAAEEEAARKAKEAEEKAQAYRRGARRVRGAGRIRRRGSARQDDVQAHVQGTHRPGRFSVALQPEIFSPAGTSARRRLPVRHPRHTRSGSNRRSGRRRW